MVWLENGFYGIRDIEKEKLIRTKRVVFEEISFPARKENMIYTFILSLSNEDGIYVIEEENTVEMGVEGPTEDDTSPAELKETLEPDEKVQMYHSKDVYEDTQNKHLGQRYSLRDMSRPNKYAYIARKSAQGDITTFEEALQSVETLWWQKDIDEELKQLAQTRASETVDNHHDVQTVAFRRVLKLKI